MEIFATKNGNFVTEINKNSSKKTNIWSYLHHDQFIQLFYLTLNLFNCQFALD